MEDILASIRRILSEDDAPAPSSEAPAHEHPPEPDSEDVLVLDPTMMVPEPAPVTIPEEVKMTGPSDQPHAHGPEGSPAPVPGTTADTSSPANKSGLVAPSAAAAAATSVDSLVRTLSSRGTRTHSTGPTIEEIVREEVRPLLKAWLDEHLPALVERQVRLEIERVVNHTAL
jgi:hypothetical protein